jgi:hypothetical protein
MPAERRNLSFVGRKRRKEFDRSLQRLYEIGLPEWAVECYRRVARVTGLLPHEVVCHVAVSAAAHLLEKKSAQDVPDASVRVGDL